MNILLRALFSILIFSMLLGCDSNPTDSFSGIESYFTTDKNEYKDGDTILLTINLVNNNNTSREVRLYSNLKNINIWSNYLSQCFPNHPDLCKDYDPKMIEDIKKEKIDSDIQTYILTKEKSYSTTLQGSVSENETQFIINFPEYGFKSIVDKDIYKKSEDFGFTGHLRPINPSGTDSLEDFIAFKSIKLIERK